jgi:hypothetical protein
MYKRTEEFSEEEKQMINDHWKKYSISWATKEIQIKTILSFHDTLVILAKQL